MTFFIPVYLFNGLIAFIFAVKKDEEEGRNHSFGWLIVVLIHYLMAWPALLLIESAEERK
jgi:hypothetical protein